MESAPSTCELNGKFCYDYSSDREGSVAHKKSSENFCVPSLNSSESGAVSSTETNSHMLLSADEISVQELEYNVMSTSETKLNCKFCHANFPNRKECLAHEKTCDEFYVIPRKSSSTPVEDVTNTIKCKFCSKTFTLKKNCNRHENSCPGNSTSIHTFKCDVCGITTNRKDNFVSHRKRCQEKLAGPENSLPKNADEAELTISEDLQALKNRIRPKVTCNKRTKSPCLFPGCDLEFYHKTSLIEHLQNFHDEADVKEPIMKQFNSIDEFEKWRAKEQDDTFSFFSQKSGLSPGSRIKYLYCQHDGSSHSYRKTDRINSKGRIKVGRHCIAHMKVWEDAKNMINVQYYPTHNHKCSSQDSIHHPASKDARRYTDDSLSSVKPSATSLLFRHCRDLKDNIEFLVEVLESGKSDLISHAATLTHDLVLQLKSMKDECVEEICPVAPSKQTLKTEVPRMSSFRTPPPKRRAGKPQGGSPNKLMAVTKDLGISGGEDVSHPVNSNFSPSLSFVFDAEDVILKCGYENITLLHLKSLELDMSDEHIKICKKLDPAFNVGCVSSVIVNAFLTKLSEMYPSCIALSSDLAIHASRGLSNLSELQRCLKHREGETSWEEDDVILFPANISGIHWIIVAIILDSTKPQFQYYDPMQKDVDCATEKFLVQVNSDLKTLLPSFPSDWSEIMYVEAEKQTDRANSGVHICSFAEQVAKKLPYHLISNTHAFRKSMYDMIVGGCLKRRKHYYDESCGICQKEILQQCVDDDRTWVSCSKCEQWYHQQCVGDPSHPFVCPV